MRIISHFHIDQHAALIALVDTAWPKIDRRVENARAMHAEVARQKVEFAALPWYKRWFALCEPSYEHANMHLHFAKQNLELLQKIKWRAGFQLTIELSDQEANIVFQDQT